MVLPKHAPVKIPVQIGTTIRLSSTDCMIQSYRSQQSKDELLWVAMLAVGRGREGERVWIKQIWSCNCDKRPQHDYLIALLFILVWPCQLSGQNFTETMDKFCNVCNVIIACDFIGTHSWVAKVKAWYRGNNFASIDPKTSISKGNKIVTSCWEPEGLFC